MVQADRSALERFYRDVIFELGEFAQRRKSTAQGAAVVVKRVALAHGIPGAAELPLPRLTRAELEERGGPRGGYVQPQAVGRPPAEHVSQETVLRALAEAAGEL